MPRWLLAVLALVVGVGLLGGGYLYFSAVRARASMEAVRDQFAQAKHEIIPTTAPTGGTAASVAAATARATPRPAAAQLGVACDRADEAEQTLNSVGQGGLGSALAAARSLPLVSGQAGAASELLASGQEASEGLASLCRGMRPLLDVMDHSGGGNGGTGPAVLAALAQGRPDLEAAQAKLAEAQQRLDALDPQQVKALGGDAEQAAAALREQLPHMQQASETLLVMPTIFGGEGRRTYLVLSQNSDELRPTGGFIGTVGMLTLDGGKVVSFDYSSSVDYDLGSGEMVRPPDALHTYLHSNYWQLRDANWWPDFPSTAAQMEYFLAAGGRPQTDGVIALDQTAVEDLLKALGAVDVPEYNERIDAENMRARLDDYVHGSHDYASEEERKAFVGALSRAVMKALLDVPPDRVGAVAAGLRSGLDEKHILIWTRDQRPAALLASAGWDGALRPVGTGDYLYVVNSNLTPNKEELSIERTLKYAVERDAGGAVAHLTIHFKNTMDPPGPEDAPYMGTGIRWDLYRDYLRIYVPPGATLQGASGFTDAPRAVQECGRTAFQGTVEVHPQAEATVELAYRLPAAVASALADGTYALTVQKQPGTLADDLDVALPGAQPLTGASVWVDRFLRIADGKVVADGQPQPSGGPSEPLCAIHSDPPQVLQPPARIAIPAVGIDAPIVNLGVDPDGTMQIPETGDVVGWYSDGAYPGYPGNSVYAAHVDWHKQAAVFWPLRDLAKGDEVNVQAKDGTWQTYVVSSNYMIPFDTPASRAVGPTYRTKLTLITCDGEFDQATHNYLSRRIVHAYLKGAQDGPDPTD